MKKAQLVPLKAAKWHPQTTQQRLGARTAPTCSTRIFRLAAQSEMGGRYHLHRHGRRLVVSGRPSGFVFPAGGGLGHGDRMDVRPGGKCLEHGRHPSSSTRSDLLHHSDRGSQYTSDAYLKLLEKAQCMISMSRTGNCYDNAAMESFFATLKGECAFQQFPSKAEARRPSLNSSRFGTIAKGYIHLWAISAPWSLSNLQDINRVHFFSTVHIVYRSRGKAIQI